MSVLTGLNQANRRVIALITAFVTALTVMVFGGAGVANADPRDWLRADNSSNGSCDWDPSIAWYVQRCEVWSPASGKNITVQIQAAARGGNAGLYLLDGLRATDRANAWTVDVNAPERYVDNNITLVMPVGGAGSFYADWQGDSATYDLEGGPNYMWETFLTSELPGYLERNFGVARDNNSIIGLSMGGTAALNIAAKHPNMFRQALSYSGYLTPSAPGMQNMIRLALLDAGGYNINEMYGSVLNPRRYENDPFHNMEGLRGMDVYISAASGQWGPEDDHYPANLKASGTPLEVLALATTRAFHAKADVIGLPVTADYPATGIHNWTQFGSQLDKTRGRVLDVMNAH